LVNFSAFATVPQEFVREFSREFPSSASVPAYVLFNANPYKLRRSRPDAFCEPISPNAVERHDELCPYDAS
jgi:hypothetical protein